MPLRALTAAAFFLASLAAQSAVTQSAATLDNGTIRVEFDARGLHTLRFTQTGQTVELARDGFAIVAGDTSLESAWMPAAKVESSDQRVTFAVQSGEWRVRSVYELQAGWHFVTKQVFVERTDQRSAVVHRIEPLRAAFATVAASEVGIHGGVLRRYADSSGEFSLFVMVQNPFGQWHSNGNEVSLGYAPHLPAGEQAFVSDRVCLGLLPLTGRTQPLHPRGEWDYVPDGTRDNGPRIDDAEVDALVGCARSFLLYHPQQTSRVHIGWCENDYQIDISTESGRAEYQRILDQAAAVGCKHVLFTPANNALAPLANNKDAWGWENVLWLGMGQKIRTGTWEPGRDPLPASVQKLLDHAQSRGLQPMAYVYPSLPFLQQKDWTSWVKGEPGGYLGADTGQRSFQDWIVERMTTFAKATGTAGICFDHWWIAYDDTPSSHYAQWDGCRRVLTELRRKLPDAVIDGRQQYHWFGVWTWLAGSYPHPLQSDEQPESFRSFPDLHWDRASADRQRRTSYGYRTREFTPVEILPGYMTHQTGRLDEKGACPRERFRPRDFDLLGWRYSVISAIATAPYQLIVNFLPARDEAEFRAFGTEHQQWLRGWMDWTDQNLEVLKHTRPILGDVQLGRCDANAACKDDHGFVFVFNPNYRVLPASFVLDDRIGLVGGERFVLRQLYPEAGRGRLLPSPTSTSWQRGETVTLTMPGAEALVVQIEPLGEPLATPRLAGAPGTVVFGNGVLTLTNVEALVGAASTLAVTLSDDEKVTACLCNGQTANFEQHGREVTVHVAFAGAAFERCQQIGNYDPTSPGGAWRGKTTIPARVFAQLAARKQAWPVNYDADDLRAGYLGSDRLLLYVQIAQPDDETMTVTLQVDGKPIELRKAWSSIVRSNPKNTFVGWFADVSSLAPDVEHTFELALPQLLPGQFQGVFFDTVESETTREVRPH